ncbi:MAG: hypothetical protein SFW67_20135 [Myxococcaceae bacterium]|nr:hypothetical protein [Myxococcaceae bacterium]
MPDASWDSSESPWEFVTRRRAAGADDGAIARELATGGLPADDIELLLPGFGGAAPPVRAPEPARAPDLATASLLRWFVVMAGVALALAAPALADGAWFGLALGAICGLGALVAFAFEFRAGPRRTARRVGVTLAVVGALGGLPFVVFGNGGPVTFTLTGLGVLGAGLAVWGSLYREALRGLEGVAPNETVFELDDVQFVIRVPLQTGPIERGVERSVTVLAQCVNSAPRWISIALEPQVGAFLVAEPVRAELAPGVAAEIAVPIVVDPVCTATRVGFNVVIDAGGSVAGVRLVRRAGTEWSNRTDAATTNVLGVATLLTVGVGRFQLEDSGPHVSWLVDVSTPGETPRLPLRAVVTERYRPDPETVARAAST